MAATMMRVGPQHIDVTCDATHLDAWVTNLDESLGEGQCQSMVAFSDHPCSDSPQWYVELEIRGYSSHDPHWEGRLCSPCLTGWKEWAIEDPYGTRVMSVTPLAA